MADAEKTAMITETKINGIIFIVESSFKKGCTETAAEKMEKILQNELCGAQNCA